MKSRPLLLIASLLLTATTALSNDEIDSIGEPSVKWSQRSVSVCWEKPSDALMAFTSVERAIVQNTIQKEYTRERTGIEFVGWKDCAKNTSGKVVRLLQDTDLAKDRDLELAAKEAPTFWDAVATPPLANSRRMTVAGYSEIGQGGQLTTSYKTKWVFFQGDEERSGYFTKKPADARKELYLTAYRKSKHVRFHAQISYLDELQITAVHEFGHLAGLRHEHARQESQADLNCFSDHEIDSLSETTYESTRAYTDYDPNSIMNYCWIHLLKRYGLTWYYTEATLRKPEMKTVSKPPFMIPVQTYVFPDPTADLRFQVLPRLEDETLYAERRNPKTQEVKRTVKIGLSQKDIYTLRQLYP